MLFKDIDNIDTNVVSILSQSGITDMTDVQAKTYKHISNNKDVIVCSGTGTGKTLAYLCPIISHITGNNNSFKNNNADISSKNNNAGSTVNNKNTYNGHKPTHSKNIQAIILVPNGELASQVNHQAEQLFSYEGCPYTSDGFPDLLPVILISAFFSLPAITAHLLSSVIHIFLYI